MNVGEQRPASTASCRTPQQSQSGSPVLLQQPPVPSRLQRPLSLALLHTVAFNPDAPSSSPAIHVVLL
jgi:hypothetical protein